MFHLYFCRANIAQAARETDSLQVHISTLRWENEDLQTQLKEANEQQEEVVCRLEYRLLLITNTWVRMRLGWQTRC